MNSIQNMAILPNLPMELCQELLLYLNGNDIFKTKKIFFKIPKAIFEDEYFWKLKFKADQLLTLKRHQYSEDYENYKQNFQCSEKAFYTYLYKLRQIWLTKSWNDALKIIPTNTLANIMYADERFIVKIQSTLGERSIFRNYQIINTTTNEVISKFTTRKHDSMSNLIVRFPFVISRDFLRNEILVWNAENQKLLWKHRFSRTFGPRCLFCANDNTIGALTHDATQLSLIEISSGIIKANLPHSAEINRAHFCNKFVITETNNRNSLYVWDVDKKELKYSFDETSYMRTYAILNYYDEYAVFRRQGDYSHILKFEDGTIHKFKTNIHDRYVSSNNSNNMVLRKSKIIFIELDNNLKVVDYTTRECIIIKKYETELQMITANSNFVFLKTLYDIRMLENESCRELRIFAPNTINGIQIRDADRWFFKATESKLILQYGDALEQEYPICQFMLDFKVI